MKTSDTNYLRGGRGGAGDFAMGLNPAFRAVVVEFASGPKAHAFLEIETYPWRIRRERTSAGGCPRLCPAERRFGFEFG